MEILVEEQEGMYCVCVKVEKYDPRVKRKTIVNTGAVKRELLKQGYKIGEVIQSDYVHNLNGKVQGTWFFEKKAKKQLDKPVKEVIIEEEKPAPVKTARRRRSKPSTKKISSEE